MIKIEEKSIDSMVKNLAEASKHLQDSNTPAISKARELISTVKGLLLSKLYQKQVKLSARLEKK